MTETEVESLAASSPCDHLFSFRRIAFFLPNEIIIISLKELLIIVFYRVTQIYNLTSENKILKDLFILFDRINFNWYSVEFGRRHIHPAFYFGDMFIVRPFQIDAGVYRLTKS